VRVDKAQVGRQLARMAIEKLQQPGTRIPEVVVPVTFVKRATTRPLLGVALAPDSAARA